MRPLAFLFSGGSDFWGLDGLMCYGLRTIAKSSASQLNFILHAGGTLTGTRRCRAPEVRCELLRPGLDKLRVLDRGPRRSGAGIQIQAVVGGCHAWRQTAGAEGQVVPEHWRAHTTALGGRTDDCRRLDMVVYRVLKMVPRPTRCRRFAVTRRLCHG